jgi:MPBQ/MSBQ methyltransferase
MLWILAPVLLLGVGLAAYVLTARKYRSPESVARAYDEWTRDGILEFYWGEHIHLGHYGSPPRRKNFIQAKHDFVHEMVRWGGLDRLPPGQQCWMWAVALAAAAASWLATMALW